jgi:hypothetical protein
MNDGINSLLDNGAIDMRSNVTAWLYDDDDTLVGEQHKKNESESKRAPRVLLPAHSAPHNALANFQTVGT